MRKLVICIATALCLVAGGMPSATAAPVGVSQPSGSVPIPDGPAQAWIIADLDSGAVLAARDEYGQYAPASTIKVLLALTVLDELPLEATVVANDIDTKVVCNCAGVAPGREYTARQLLEALLLVSGNDAANTLATMLGGREAAVMKMNGKAALLGAYGTNVGSPSGLDGPGIDMWSSPHDLALIFRAAMANPVFAQITAQPSTVFPTKTGDKVLVNQNELLQALSRHHRRQDRLHRHRPEDVRRRRRAQRPPARRCTDVRHGQTRRSHLLGSGRQHA